MQLCGGGLLGQHEPIRTERFEHAPNFSAAASRGRPPRTWPTPRRRCDAMQVPYEVKPSPIAGVGVFALREIPARTDPFQGPNAHMRLPETVVSVTQSELDDLEPAVRTHVLSMFGTLDDPRPRGGPLRDR